MVCRDTYELDDESIHFPVKVSVYILNSIRLFRVRYTVFLRDYHFTLLNCSYRCIYSADQPHLFETPVPCAGTKIRFTGFFSKKLFSSTLAVELEDIELVFGPGGGVV